MASHKYNFESIRSKPELKMQTDWPACRLQLTEETLIADEIFERRKAFDDSRSDMQGGGSLQQSDDEASGSAHCDQDDDGMSYYDEEGSHSQQSYEDSFELDAKPLDMFKIKRNSKRPNKMRAEKNTTAHCRIY